MNTFVVFVLALCVLLVHVEALVRTARSVSSQRTYAPQKHADAVVTPGQLLTSDGIISPRRQVLMPLAMGARNRAWAKGDLSDKDIFEDDVEGDEGGADGKKSKKDKMKLDPETTLYDGPPSATEILFPALSVLTVIGIVPFVAALSRQFWVKYKFTSRRVSIQSGFGGNTQSEIIYPDIEEIRFVYRAFGSAGDMVLFLKDGAKVELRHVPKFNEIYEYVLSKCDAACQEKSMKLSVKQ
jgi:Bacterial PH domain